MEANREKQKFTLVLCWFVQTRLRQMATVDQPQLMALCVLTQCTFTVSSLLTCGPSQSVSVFSPGLKWFGSLSNLSTRRSSASNKTPECDGSDMASSLPGPSYARSSDMYTHVGTVPRGDKTKSFRGRKKKQREEEGGVSRVWAGDHVRDSPLLTALSTLSLSRLEGALPDSVQARPLPAPPGPQHASPLTSAPDNRLGSTSGGVMKSQQAQSGSVEDLEGGRPKGRPSIIASQGSKAALTQDVYVPMDPIAEAAGRRVDGQTDLTCSQETTQVAKDWQEVEDVNR